MLYPVELRGRLKLLAARSALILQSDNRFNLLQDFVSEHSLNSLGRQVFYPVELGAAHMPLDTV